MFCKIWDTVIELSIFILSNVFVFFKKKIFKNIITHVKKKERKLKKMDS